MVPDSSLAEFAADLKELATRNGFSVRDLARATGVARSTVGDALQGRRLPRLDTVLAIVRACGAGDEPWRTRWTGIQLTRTPAATAPPPTETAPPPAAAPGDGEPTDPVPATRRVSRIVLAVAAGICALVLGGVGYAIARGTAHPAPAGPSCEPVRRYDVVQSGNLLDASHRIVTTTRPGDVFYAYALDASPYTARHFGLLERTGQQGYVDAAKLAHGTAACLPTRLPR